MADKIVPIKPLEDVYEDGEYEEFKAALVVELRDKTHVELVAMLAKSMLFTQRTFGIINKSSRDIMALMDEVVDE